MRFDLRIAIAAALALPLGACGLFIASPWKAGEDPRGRELKGRAVRVVVALQHFRSDAGHLPNHLFELTPKYLPLLPDGLKMVYEPEKDTLAFSYEPPDTGVTNCSTTIDAVAWYCYSTF